MLVAAANARLANGVKGCESRLYQRGPLSEHTSARPDQTGPVVVHRTGEEGDQRVRAGTQAASKEKSRLVAMTASLGWTDLTPASPPHGDTERPSELHALGWRWGFSKGEEKEGLSAAPREEF